MNIDNQSQQHSAIDPKNNGSSITNMYGLMVKLSRMTTSNQTQDILI